MKVEIKVIYRLADSDISYHGTVFFMFYLADIEWLVVGMFLWMVQVMFVRVPGLE